MAEKIPDFLQLKLTNSAEALSNDFPNDKPSHAGHSTVTDLESASHAAKLVEALEKYTKASNGRTIGIVDSPRILNDLSFEYSNTKFNEMKAANNAIWNDYAGKKEYKIEVVHKRGGFSSEQKLGEIEITPQNVDKLIALTEKAASEGEKLRNALTASGIKPASDDDLAKVELTMRNTLKDGLKGIGR